MINKVKAFLKRVKYTFSKNYCYDQMERDGIAAFGMCEGLVGGDKFSNYLQYSCIDCPYFVDTILKGGKKDE